MVRKEVVPLVLEFLRRQLVYFCFVGWITSDPKLSQKFVFLPGDLVVFLEFFFIFVKAFHVAGVLNEF